MAVWTKWRESRNKFSNTCKQALSDCPEIEEAVETIQLLNDLRHGSASDELKENKSIQNDDNKVFTECTSHVCLMLEESFLILERYDEAPPVLTADYLELTSKAKSDKEVEASQFKLSNTSQPSTSTEYSYIKKDDGNATVDSSDSDDLIYVENRELARMAPKRKGTSIILANDEIIIINDSLESIDMTRNVGSAKKVKLEFEMGTDVENYGVSEPNKLNSTFLVAEKIKENKKPIKMEQKKKNR
ncbi:putative kinesin heavy chain [Operophtera brumata]|uniref:Putative kinesin heavy chain n=1 Tax=Operophtera brumata TaxID=104452 RepID=A0A0L7K4A4_OPEBR|nr:putative kinesin heavy chain [Operophtera brumata]